MINKGETIVYKASDEYLMFFWLCDIQGNDLIFFNWYANPRKAAPNDFWKMSTSWFNKQVEEGKMEVFASLPLEKYGDIFEKQAIERSN
jgi:hypothetical protein